MTQPPGLPRLAATYGLMLSIFILGASIFQGILSVPVFLVSGVEFPNIFQWIVFAFAGWIVLYTADVIQFIRLNGFDELRGLVESASRREWAIMIGLVAVYLNAVLGIAGLLAFVSMSVIGSPILALLIALTYPNVDLMVAARWRSPASLAIDGVLALPHTVGIYRELTAGVVIGSLRGRNPPRQARPT